MHPVSEVDECIGVKSSVEIDVSEHKPSYNSFEVLYAAPEALASHGIGLAVNEHAVK